MDFSEQLFARFSSCRIFCGFSGGADSTAALLLARKYQEKFHYELTAVHFNHHLRGAESDREAEKAGLFAKTLGIPFRCIDLKLPPAENLESAARAARLEAWHQLLPPNSAVVLGHHADDRRENLLIRLCRGSNSGGLSSMRSVSEIGGVTFLRPLLSMTRGEIELFLRCCGVEEWASDSSNASTVYLRNYLRNILLPDLEEHFPGSLKGMDRSLHALEEDADFISSYVEAIPSGSRKSISFWRSQHNAVRIRLLRELTGTLPTRDLLARINRELENDSSELRRIPVPGGGEIFLRGDTIEKGSPTVPAPDTLLWEWRKEPAVLFGKWRFSAVFAENTEKCSTDCAFFDAELLPDVLEISLPRPGERMIPFGAKSEQKIKKLRTDRHLHSGIPLPVVRADGKICWAVLVRHSASAPVTSETKKIVKFSCQEF